MSAHPPLDGHLVVITGGTGGIGLATAHELAARGATTVVVGRSADTAERAVVAIREAAGHDRVHHELADLAERDQVVELAGRLNDRFATIDTLLHNAGALRATRTVSAGGDEVMLAVNHLAPVLLTHHLLPALRRSSAPHVIGVNTAAHAMSGAVDPTDLQHERSWPNGVDNVYARTKLINLVVTRELARRVPDVPRNLLNPGGARTAMTAELDPHGLPVGVRLMMRATSIAYRFSSPERASRANVALTAEARFRRRTGQYYGPAARPATVGRRAQDPALGVRLLDATQQLLDLDLVTAGAA